MDKTFAAKLKNGITAKSPVTDSRKRSLSYTDEDCLRKRVKETSCVNVFTVGTTSPSEADKDDQFLIIHIPTSRQKNVIKNTLEKPNKNLSLNGTDTGMLWLVFLPLLSTLVLTAIADKSMCLR